MKVTNDNDLAVTIELENPESWAAFKAGREDRRQWVRTPETQELSQFVNDNHRFSQIIVRYGDGYARIK